MAFSCVQKQSSAPEGRRAPEGAVALIDVNLLIAHELHALARRQSAAEIGGVVLGRLVRSRMEGAFDVGQLPASEDGAARGGGLRLASGAERGE